MKKLLLSLLLLTSCSALGERPDKIKVSAISATVDVIVERHDGYVESDMGLSNESRAFALAESSHLRDTLGTFPPEAKIPVSMIADDVRAVSTRHDEYVLRDMLLDELSQGVYLRSTALLVRLVIQAESARPSGP